MSMADNLRKGVMQKKEGFNSEAEFRDLLNSAATKSLKQFIQRMEAGEIPIDNISDFIRVIGAYKEINGISDALDGKAGQAALPEISMRQDKAFEDQVQSGKIGADEEGRLNIMDMSTEDVSNLIREMDIAQNKENEGTY